MSDFIPTSKDALLPFYNTQSTKLPTDGTILGIPAAKITATTAACNDAQAAIYDTCDAKLAYAAAVANQDAKIAAANALVRECAGLGKESAAYTTAIGSEMAWIASNIPFVPADYKAVIRDCIATAPQQVTLRFLKAGGRIDGVNIYMRRQGQLTWIAQGLSIRSPYVDNTPLVTPGVPEAREYRICGVIAGVQIGIFSEVTQVLVN